MQTKILRADQLEFLLADLETHDKHLIASYRSPWRSAEDREEARQALYRVCQQSRCCDAEPGRNAYPGAATAGE